MKINKKSIFTATLAITLAAALLIGGGTMAYLYQNTDDVINNFNANNVLVELTESTGNQYDIIPGTEQSKDPKVAVNATLDSYVYVEVTDTTEGLVKYNIAEGWTSLDGFPGVYYREVRAADAEKEFYVLKDNKVKYDAALENSDMMTNGVLKQGIALTFKASAIQKDIFNGDAVAAYKCIGTTVVSEPADFEAALNAGEPVSITKDMNIDASIIENAVNPKINMNGKTLTVALDSSKGAIVPAEGEKIKIENGTLNFIGTSNSHLAIALAKENAALEINNVTMDMGENSILVDQGVNNAVIDIIGSTIKTNDWYCFSTNANNRDSGHDVVINIKDSVMETTNPDSAAILFNIPGTMNIENSQLKANRQGVINRCGTMNIKNSTITCTGTFNDNDKYANAAWGSGNEVPMGVIVVGNRNENANGAYNYDATLSLDNVTLISENGVSEIYAAAYWGRTTTISNGGNYGQVTADSDDESTIMIK